MYVNKAIIWMSNICEAFSQVFYHLEKYNSLPLFHFFSLLFIYLAVLGLSCGTRDLSLQPTGSLAVAHRFSSGSTKP